MVEQRLYFGYVPLAEIFGLRNEIDGAVTTRGFTTHEVDVRVVESQWRRIESIEELAVKPVILLVATDVHKIGTQADGGM